MLFRLKTIVKIQLLQVSKINRIILDKKHLIVDFAFFDKTDILEYIGRQRK